MEVFDRLKHAWDVFRNRDPTKVDAYALGPSYGRDPTKLRLSINNERTQINTIWNKIAVDVAALKIRHIRTNTEGAYQEDIDDDLNKCFTVATNRDQIPRAFFQDCVLTMFDQGTVAIFPEDCDMDPTKTGSYMIWSMRKGVITEWYPNTVRVRAWDVDEGRDVDLLLPKSMVAIVENPFYSIMNAPNSTLQRLLHKLALLDAIDNQIGSGKLDVIIQLPYALKSDQKKEQAEGRRKMLEDQLNNSKYGVAYMDITEKVIQLNRPVENNLLEQVQYLRQELYSQLGMTPGIFDGTADEQTQLNYTNTTVEPIISAIVSCMHWKFLTKTARSQGQAIAYFRDPFKLAPISQTAELADKFIRNEILTPNEFRSLLGMKPADDPKADELRNPNIAAAKQEMEEYEAPPTEDSAEEVG